MASIEDDLWKMKVDRSGDPKREPGPITLQRYVGTPAYSGIPTFMGAPICLTQEDLKAGKVDVAIDIWTSFCELALAGGPCHRKTLLEAVPAAVALADPDKYQAVVAEIERGIKLVTGLPVVRSTIPGWVGVRCDSEAMAVWLLRAIIVENVMVRRECEVLYLPAGPNFTLQREIKNVVTVVAKTFHYWAAHIKKRTVRSGEPSLSRVQEGPIS